MPALSQGCGCCASRRSARHPGQWVRIVGGWTGAQFAEKRLPTVSDLNAAAPDTPVLVLHLCQSAILNRPAVAALGYAKDTPDPPGGTDRPDHAGLPTDVLLATPAPSILCGVLGRLPVLDQGQQVSCTRHFLRELNRFGITSAIDGVGGSQQFPGNYAAVMQLARSGDLSVWGLLSGDDNVRGGPAGSGITGSWPRRRGLVVDEVVAGRAVLAGSRRVPHAGCRGVPPGRRAWLPSAPAGAAPRRARCLRRSAGRRPGRPLRVGPGNQQPFPLPGHRPWPGPRQAGDEPFSCSAMS